MCEPVGCRIHATLFQKLSFYRLYLYSQAEASKGDPRSQQQRRTGEQHAPTEYPKCIEPAVIEDGTSDRRSNQYTQRHDRKALSQPRANLIPPILAQPDNDSRRQTNKAAREEPIKRHQHANTRAVVDRNVADTQHAADQTARDDHVERPKPIREDVGDDPPKHTRRVHDRQEVEREVLVRQVAFQRVHLRVEERHVQPHEPAEEADDLQRIRRDAERLQIQQTPTLGRQHADPHARTRHDHGGQDDEAEHARRPCEADFRQQIMKDNRIDHASKTAPGSRDADRHTDPGAKVRAQDRHAGHEQCTGADADAECLREQDLPVRCAQREHHLAEDEHEAAEEQEFAEVASVIDGAC